MNKKFIILTLSIILILGIVFWGQQSSSPKMIKDFMSFVRENAGAALSDRFNRQGTITNNNINAPTGQTEANTIITQDSPFTTTGFTSSNSDAQKVQEEKWTFTNIPQKTIEAVKSGGEAIVNGITNTTEKISENISDTKTKTENYFSGIVNSITQPGTPQNCQCPKPD